MPNYSSRAKPTQLSAPVTSSDTNLVLVQVSGYPDAPFNIVVDGGTASEEVMLVTAVAGDMFTVVRGQDGTPALPHTTNAEVCHGVVGSDLQAASDHRDADSVVHGLDPAGGKVVGTNATQTLRNKSLSGDDNTFAAISQGSITGLPTRLAGVDSSIGNLGVLHTEDAGNLKDHNHAGVNLVPFTSGDGSYVGDIHGLGSMDGVVVGTSATQTLTKKTIDSANNTIYKPYMIRTAEPSADQRANSGMMRAFVTTNVEESRGDWSGGLTGLHSSQFVPPKSGIYEVKAKFHWSNYGSGITDAVYLQLRRGMTAGESSSGSVYRAEADYPSFSREIGVSFHVLLTAGVIYGWTVRNLSSGDIQYGTDPSRTNYSVIFSCDS